MIFKDGVPSYKKIGVLYFQFCFFFVIGFFSFYVYGGEEENKVFHEGQRVSNLSGGTPSVGILEESGPSVELNSHKEKITSLRVRLNHPGVDNAEIYYRIGRENLKLGSVPSQSHYLDEALDSFRRAIEAEGRKGCDSYPINIGMSYNNIGKVFKEQGHFIKAVGYYKKAAVSGYRRGMYNYGRVLIDLDQNLIEAREWLERAVSEERYKEYMEEERGLKLREIPSCISPAHYYLYTLYNRLSEGAKDKEFQKDAKEEAIQHVKRVPLDLIDNKRKWTILHLAAYEGNLDFIEALQNRFILKRLKKGKKTTILARTKKGYKKYRILKESKTKDNHTASDLAHLQGHINTYYFLKGLPKGSFTNITIEIPLIYREGALNLPIFKNMFGGKLAYLLHSYNYTHTGRFGFDATKWGAAGQFLSLGIGGIPYPGAGVASVAIGKGFNKIGIRKEKKKIERIVQWMGVNTREIEVLAEETAQRLVQMYQLGLSHVHPTQLFFLVTEGTSRIHSYLEKNSKDLISKSRDEKINTFIKGVLNSSRKKRSKWCFKKKKEKMSQSAISILKRFYDSPQVWVSSLNKDFIKEGEKSASKIGLPYTYRRIVTEGDFNLWKREETTLISPYGEVFREKRKEEE